MCGIETSGSIVVWWDVSLRWRRWRPRIRSGGALILRACGCCGFVPLATVVLGNDDDSIVWLNNDVAMCDKIERDSMGLIAASESALTSLQRNLPLMTMVQRLSNYLDSTQNCSRVVFRHIEARIVGHPPLLRLSKRGETDCPLLHSSEGTWCLLLSLTS